MVTIPGDIDRYKSTFEVYSKHPSTISIKLVVLGYHLTIYTSNQSSLGSKDYSPLNQWVPGQVTICSLDRLGW